MSALALILLIAACGKGSTAPAADYAIEHVTIVDVEAGRTVPQRTVLIAGRRIVAVEDDGAFDIGAEAQRIDGTGNYLIPGLWEMHGHVDDGGAWQFPAYLALGITGLRDLGSHLDRLSEWKRAWRDAADMPRVVAAGPIVIGVSADPDPRVVPVNTPTEAVAVVDSLVRAGVDFIKVYDWIPRAVYLAIADAARARGVPIAGHLPLAASLEEAISAGQRSIEHDGNAIGGLLLHVARDPLYLQQARSYVGKRFDPSFLVAADERRLTALLASYSDAKADSIAGLLARANVFVTPTIVGYSVYQLPPDTGWLSDERRAYVPRTWLSYWDQSIRGYLADPPADEVQRLGRRLVDTRARLLRSLHAAGVPILAGTDLSPWVGGIPGFALHEELARLVAAGLSPATALQAATVNPARYFTAADSLGTVAVGKLADLVLLDANPLDDIRNTERVRAVFSDGRYYDRAALDQLLVRARAAAASVPVQ